MSVHITLYYIVTRMVEKEAVTASNLESVAWSFREVKVD